MKGTHLNLTPNEHNHGCFYHKTYYSTLIKPTPVSQLDPKLKKTSNRLAGNIIIWRAFDSAGEIFRRRTYLARQDWSQSWSNRMPSTAQDECCMNNCEETLLVISHVVWPSNLYPTFRNCFATSLNCGRSDKWIFVSHNFSVSSLNRAETLGWWSSRCSIKCEFRRWIIKQLNGTYLAAFGRSVRDAISFGNDHFCVVKQAWNRISFGTCYRQIGAMVGFFFANINLKNGRHFST